MILLRPAQEQDIPAVYELAGNAPAGLTTLPHDLEKITSKVMESVKNLHYPPSSPKGESFLFVLEHDGKVVGTSAIFSKVGGFEPFWTYQIKSLNNRYDKLNVDLDIKYLEVKREHNGPSEIGTLYLDPKHRHQNAGRLLSLGRFMFIAQHREMFENEILAELRGTIDKQGNAVFWDAIGAHFFGIPFTKADMMVNEDKNFIDELMPKFPIYIDLLPKDAQLVMGVVAEETRPALRLLEQEGFEAIDEVDIFEAGPVVQCATDKIRTISQSNLTKIGEALQGDEPATHLIANVNSIADFKVTVSYAEIDGEKVHLPNHALDLLEVKPGDTVRVSPLRPDYPKSALI